VKVPTFVLALLGCLALVAGTAVLLGDFHPTDEAAAAPVSSTTVCADILLVGMTGSGEGSSTTTPFGRTLEPFRRTYVRAALAGGRTLRQHYLGRPTSTATTLKTSPGADGPASSAVTATTEQRWEGDLSGDATRIVSALGSAASSCPRQQIVLVGYAQGAMAMHRTLLKLAHQPGIFRRVVAATLIADGDRVPRTAAIRSGAEIASATAKGVHPWFRAAMADVPQSAWTVPVWSVCERHDVACDLSSAPIKEAITAHRSYLTGPPADAVRTVAQRVWARTTRWAYPVHDLTQDSSLGVKSDSRLPVLVEASDRDTTVFANATNLPPGMRLEADGRLTGTPTTSGQWRVDYTVSNTVSAVFDRPVPGTVDVQVLNPAPRSLSAGGEHTCAIRAEGGAWCWGRNSYGQLGNGQTGPGTSTPTRVGTADDWRRIAAGGASTCAIRNNGTLWCWGLNHRGQLGDDTTKSKSRPVRVGTSSAWASVSAGWFDTCGVRTDGSLWCWGDNSDGQLGDGTTTRRLVPTRLSGSSWTSVTVGGWHVCATRSDGTLWCWGRNDFGQLGDDSFTNRHVPTRVGSQTDWTQVSASWSSTCGVRRGGALLCWGRNDRGQVGDGSTQTRRIPNQVAGNLTARRVAVGDAQACAVDTNDVAWCWGSNDYGTLGDGTHVSRGTPTRVAGTFRYLNAGWMHMCAVTVAGSAECWGNNERGQIGDGTTVDRLSPTSQS